VRTRLLIAAVCLAGLGSTLWTAPASDAQTSTGPDAAAVQAVLLRFADARFADDGAAMCPLFTVRALRSFGLTGPVSGCPAYLAAFFTPDPAAPAPTLAQMEARYAGATIDVAGASAIATVQMPATLYLVAGTVRVPFAGTLTYNEGLVRRHGSWRISAMSVAGG